MALKFGSKNLPIKIYIRAFTVFTIVNKVIFILFDFTGRLGHFLLNNVR